MRAASADDRALDGRTADAAGLAGATVRVMMELKEAGDSVGIYVVGYGGATELNGLSENFEKGFAKASQLGAGEAAGLAGWANAGVEERFVSVDVADAMKQ